MSSAGDTRWSGASGEERHLLGDLVLCALALTDVETLSLQIAQLLVQLVQLAADTDDSQELLSLLVVGHDHELRQVDCKLLDEAVEKLLACLLAGRVGHGERCVLARALDHKAVAQLNVQLRRCGAALAVGLGRLLALSAERPRDCIDHTGLALAVATADDGKPVLGRGSATAPDSLDVLELKRRDLHGLRLRLNLFHSLFHCSFPSLFADAFSHRACALFPLVLGSAFFSSMPSRMASACLRLQQAGQSPIRPAWELGRTSHLPHEIQRCIPDSGYLLRLIPRTLFGVLLDGLGDLGQPRPVIISDSSR